jgi:hypothetical protein
MPNVERNAADEGAAQIAITPEMIEAGMLVLDSECAEDAAQSMAKRRQAVVEIFRAMFCAVRPIPRAQT